MLSIPILLCIFTNGAIWSPSAFLLFCCSWTGPWLVLQLWGSVFIVGGLYFVMMLVGALLEGGLANPSLSQKDCQTSFQLQAMESLHEQGHLLVVGVIF